MRGDGLVAFVSDYVASQPTPLTQATVALLIVCTYVVRIQRLGRSLPATWSLASLAVPSPHRSMCFECIVSQGVVDEPGVCPHVPRRVLARVGQCEGLGPQRFMPACLPCVAAVFGLAVWPPIYVQQDRPAEPQVGIAGVCRSGPSKNCTYYTVPCPTCKHVSGQVLLDADGNIDIDMGDVGLGGSTASGHAPDHSRPVAAAVILDSDHEDSTAEEPEEDEAVDDCDDVPPGQLTQAHRCQDHQHELELSVCLPTLSDMCFSATL